MLCRATCVKPASSHSSICSRQRPGVVAEHEHLEVLFAHRLRDRLEVARQRELLRESPPMRHVRPPLRASLRASASLAAKQPVTLPYIGPLPPASLNILDDLLVGLGLHHPVALRRRELRGVRRLRGDDDRRRRVRARRTAAPARRCSASPRKVSYSPLDRAAHHVDRLLEHLEPLVGARPLSPRTCSFRFSPVPTPRKKRPEHASAPTSPRPARRSPGGCGSAGT